MNQDDFSGVPVTPVDVELAAADAERLRRQIRQMFQSVVALRVQLATVTAERDALQAKVDDLLTRLLDTTLKADRAEAERDQLKAALVEVEALLNEMTNVPDPDTTTLTVWISVSQALAKVQP